MYRVRVMRKGHQERSDWIPYADAVRLAEIMRSEPGVEEVALVQQQGVLDLLVAMTRQEHEDLHHWRER